MWNGAFGECDWGLGASLKCVYRHAEPAANFRRRAVTLLGTGPSPWSAFSGAGGRRSVLLSSV